MKQHLCDCFAFPMPEEVLQPSGNGRKNFRPISRSVPCSPRAEKIVLQPPPLADVHELVGSLLPDMEPFFDKPFVFYGHSTGALVAFELSRTLRERGGPLPEHLIVSGSRAPHIPEPSPLHDLPENEFIQGLKRFSGTPETVLRNRELMDIFIPILRADLAVEETYIFNKEELLDIPISAFFGQRDKEAPQSVVAAWEEHTCNSFFLHGIEGDHFFISKGQGINLRL